MLPEVVTVFELPTTATPAAKLPDEEIEPEFATVFETPVTKMPAAESPVVVIVPELLMVFALDGPASEIPSEAKP
jgi:hypothetical protein